jgi:hypothetical protein
MLPDAPLPIAAPSSFAPDIERDLPALLAKRLGRDGTPEEFHGYRQLLWAFAIAIRAIERTEHPPDPLLPLCPAPPSTLESRASPTTARP